MRCAREKHKARQRTESVGRLDNDGSYPQVGQGRVSFLRPHWAEAWGSESVSQVAFCRKNVPYRGDSKCKGPEVGMHLDCSEQGLIWSLLLKTRSVAVLMTQCRARGLGWGEGWRKETSVAVITIILLRAIMRWTSSGRGKKWVDFLIHIESRVNSMCWWIWFGMWEKSQEWLQRFCYSCKDGVVTD